MDGMTLAGPALADDFVRNIADHAAEVDRSGAFPWESLDILHRDHVLSWQKGLVRW